MSRNTTPPIEELGLSVRAFNCLKREGIDSVGDLVERSERDLRDIKNLGALSVKEIKLKLSEVVGLTLSDETSKGLSLREQGRLEHDATRKRLMAIEDPIERMVEAVKVTNRADAAKFNERQRWLQAARWLHDLDPRKYSKHGMSVRLTPCDERMISKGFRTLPATQTPYQGEDAAVAVARTHFRQFRRQSSIRYTANLIFQDVARELIKAKRLSNKQICELTGYTSARVTQIWNNTTNGPQNDEEDVA